MKKQLQLIIAALFMSLASITGYAQQVDDEFIANNITYRVTALGSTNTVTAIDYNTAGGPTVNIPDIVSHEGINFEVTSIGNNAFFFNQLTSVTIPNSVTSIGNNAFFFNQFTSIEIPNSVTSIGRNVFQDTPLTSVRFGADIPPDLDGLGVFMNLGNNIHVVVPKGNPPGSTKSAYETETIWNQYNFRSITEEVTVGDNLIVEDITYEITALGNSNTVMIVSYLGTTATSVNIPGTVSHGPIDFEVTAIGDNVFNNNQLTSVRLGTDMPPNLGTDAFTNPGNIHVIVPAGALGNYEAAWNSLNFQSITEGVFVDETFISNGITYLVTAVGSPNTVTITGNTNTGTLTIPGTVTYGPNSFEVTSIGEEAFRNSQLTSVNIGENVTSIGAQAFQNNQLIGVAIPNKVTTIGNEAFANNQLTSVTIPNSVTNIADAAFFSNQLTSVTIGEKVINIGRWAFRNNPDLDVVTVEANIPPTLHANAFRDPGRNQIDLVVPVGAREAYKEPANGWTGFNSITLGIFTDNDIKYGIISTSPTEVEILDYTGSETDVTIPPMVMDNSSNTNYTVTSIGDNAFQGNELTSVTIGENVTSIGERAFDLNPISLVTVEANDPPAIEGNTFINRDQINVVVPKGNPVGSIKIAYENAWGTDFKSITEEVGEGDRFTIGGITYEITALGSTNTVTITENTNTGDLAIPGTVSYGPNNYMVTAIGERAFLNKGLTSVTIPGDVTRIDSLAFKDNPDLGLVTVEANIPPTLHEDAFQNRDRNQIDLVVPVGVLEAYKDPLNGWTGFNSITLGIFTDNDIKYGITSPTEVEIVDYTGPATVLTILPMVMDNNSNTNYTVTSIGDNAFQGSELTSVTIGENVTTIGARAFQDNPLTLVLSRTDTPPGLGTDAFTEPGHIHVVVPKGALGNYQNHTQWQGFNSITEELVVGDDFTVDGIEYQVTELGSTNTVTATDNTNTGDLTIPVTVSHGPNNFDVTSIGDRAFEDDQLTSVVIPEGVTHIGFRAFTDNRDMNSVVIPSTVTSIGNAAFWNCHLSNLEILGGITDIGDNTFGRNNLTSVTIPASVTSIGENAFITLLGSPSKMTGLIMLGSTPPILQSNSFTTRGEIHVTVPAGALADYQAREGEGLDWNDFKSITEEVAVGVTFTVNDIDYQVTALGSPNTVTITGNTNTGDLIIPDTVTHGPNTFEVTRIGAQAFQNNQLTGVDIPQGVTFIGNSAFSQNDLTHVTLPGSVGTIEVMAFADNPNLALVVSKPIDPPSIQANTFQNANRAQIDVVVPRGALGNYQNHTQWTDFNSIIEQVGTGDNFTVDGIEYQVTALGSPNTLMVVDYPGMATSVTISPTVQYQSVDYTVTAIGNEAFLNKGLTSVTIGENVTSIGAQAFEDNQLTSVTIPGGVTSIGSSAFGDNPNLALVRLEATDPPSIQANTFQNANRDQIDVIVPKGTLGNYQNHTQWGDFNSINEELGVGDNFTVDGIEYQVTAQGSPGKVTIVDYTGPATNVTIPQTVNHNHTDYDVTAIGDQAFNGFFKADADKLTSVEIPEGVTRIGENAFEHNRLTSVEIPDGVTTIGAHAFQSNQLTSVEIPNSVTSIGIQAFFENQLTSVEIPEGVTRIEFSVFAFNQLESVLIPNSVNTIVNFAFARNNLTSITIPDGVTSIANGAFQNNQLTSVTIPGSVVSIGASVFWNNQLTHVTIGENVTSIDQWAFEGNPNLATVVSKGTDPPSIEENTFINADRNQIDLVVPKGAEDAYGAAGWTDFNSITGGIGVSIDAPAETANLLAFTVTFQFDLDVTGFTQEHINVVNATVVDGSFSQVNGSASTYTIEMTPIACDGTITIGVSENVVEYAPNFPNLAASTTVTVNATNPTAPTVSTNSPICAGEDAVFTITGTAGDEVTYHDGASTGTTTIEANGSATVTVSGVSSDVTLDLTEVSNGSCSVSLTEMATVTVNANPVAPTISTNSPVCPGEDAVFTITGTAGDEVTYSGALSGEVIIETDGTVMVTVSGVSSDATINLTEVTNGNCSVPLTETATVTIQDDPLTAIARDITIQLDANGQATITPGQVDDGSSYGCGNTPNLSLDIDRFTCEDVGTPVTVTLTATQDGQTTTATAQVTVEEPLDNLVAMAKDITVQLDANGQATISPGDVDDGSSYGCGNTPDLSLDIDSFTCEDVGSPVTVTLAATQDGRTATATAQVTVEACPAQIGDAFIVSGMEYEITAVNPHEVKVIGYTGSATTVEIPETVDDKDVTYAVTAIGANAFVGNTDLDLVISRPTNPPSIERNTFINRNQIDLVVPDGTRQAYLENGWNGFRSITEEGQVVTAISNNELNDLTLYPNPARDKVYIDLGPGQELEQVNIRTMAGAYLYSENRLEINTARLHRGTYLFEIVTKKGDRSMRMVIIR